MFTSINLHGKKQCIYDNEGKAKTNIIIELVKLLGPTKTQQKEGDEKGPKCEVEANLEADVKETLKIIAQEDDGFLAIADYMSKEADIKHIEDIFGPKIVVALGKLLPKISEITDPPTLPSNRINDYKAYTKVINHFLQNSEEACEIGLNECVDLITKLGFFLCYRGDKILQEGTGRSI